MQNPGLYDVICNSRNRASFDHVGNRRFRVIIENHSLSYSKARSKLDKSAIVTSIMRTIQDAGGNFIRKSHKAVNHHNKWEILPIAQTKEKIGHTLRDAILVINEKGQRDIYSIIGGVRSNSLKFQVKGRLSMKAVKGMSSHSMIEDLAKSTRPRANRTTTSNTHSTQPNIVTSNKTEENLHHNPDFIPSTFSYELCDEEESTVSGTAPGLEGAIIDHCELMSIRFCSDDVNRSVFSGLSTQ